MIFIESFIELKTECCDQPVLSTKQQMFYVCLGSWRPPSMSLARNVWSSRGGVWRLSPGPPTQSSAWCWRSVNCRQSPGTERDQKRGDISHQWVRLQGCLWTLQPLSPSPRLARLSLPRLWPGVGWELKDIYVLTNMLTLRDSWYLKLLESVEFNKWFYVYPDGGRVKASSLHINRPENLSTFKENKFWCHILPISPRQETNKDQAQAHCTLCSCMCALCVLGHITFTLSLLSHSKQETYEFLQLQPQRSQYL